MKTKFFAIFAVLALVLAVLSITACKDPASPGPGTIISGTPPYDFTKSADYQKLGLVNNTVYGTVTFNGSNVINAMEQRWALAKYDSSDTIQFYPTSTHTVTGIIVDGVTNLSGNGIYGKSPEMIFLVKDSKLTVWGRNNTSEESISISFDIAVIKSDGTGWLNQGLAGGTQTVNYDYGEAKETPFDLSTLTGGTITTASQLGSTYSVYIIVRNTSPRTGLLGSNFNQTISERNVIKPEIK